MPLSIYTKTITLQTKLASQVIVEDDFEVVQTVCGVDVSYRGQEARASAVIMDIKTLRVLEQITAKSRVTTPYVPGLMMLREAKPILSILKLLKKDFDILMVDANGRLHPRRCGLACYVGIILDKPTIGVAKSLLCGRLVGKSVSLEGEVLGKVLEKKRGKKIFVSVGNKISLDSATRLARALIKKGEWMPEPLRLADKYSKSNVPDCPG